MKYTCHTARVVTHKQHTEAWSVFIKSSPSWHTKTSCRSGDAAEDFKWTECQMRAHVMTGSSGRLFHDLVGWYVAVECLAFLLRICDVLGSSKDPRAVSTGGGFSWFCQSLVANAGIVPKSRPRSLPSRYFQIYYSLFILPFDAVLSE